MSQPTNKSAVSTNQRTNKCINGYTQPSNQTSQHAKQPTSQYDQPTNTSTSHQINGYMYVPTSTSTGNGYMHQRIYLPTEQPIKPISQHAKQPASQPTNEHINKPTNQWMDTCTNEYIYRQRTYVPTDILTDQYKPISQHAKQPTSHEDQPNIRRFCLTLMSMSSWVFVSVTSSSTQPIICATPAATNSDSIADTCHPKSRTAARAAVRSSQQSPKRVVVTIDIVVVEGIDSNKTSSSTQQSAVAEARSSGTY